MTDTSDTHSRATLEWAHAAILGEGAIWHPAEKRLYWVDIEGKQLHVYDPATKQDTTYPVPARIGTVVPITSGGVLVALQTGIHKMNLNAGTLEFIVNPLPDSAMRFNDGKCDPTGRFWVGSLALDARRNKSSLYRIDANQSVHVMLNDVTVSNGIVWTSDRKTMYYNDTPTGTVQAFDFDASTGEISNRRVVITIPPNMGAPDGMTIDEYDKLWIALWGGNAVARFDPVSGQLMQKIDVPAPNVTSCAFGGENLETLFITTARAWLSSEQLTDFPMSGSLFAVKPGVKGVPANLFR